MEATAAASTGRTAWGRNLGAPVRAFLHAETSGALLLIGGAVAALVWANSPWPDSYQTVWGTNLSIRLGGHALGTDLRQWVNQGLMTLFFLVVGLEAKRELDLGELRQRTRIAIPVIAALGGVGGAVGTYLLINAGHAGAGGWGAAMSTDTALALGVLTLVGPTGATRLRVFLLTLAIFDDLVGLIAIAVAYTHGVSFLALAVAVGLFGVLIALRYAGPWRGPAAVVVGVSIWVSMFESGIDPVIAGLAIGLVTSAYPPAREDLERATALTISFREQPTPQLAASAQRSLASAISPNERLQYRLHPWTSFVIVPLFALANAGLRIDGTLLREAVRSRVTIGIVAAYVLGKPVGIMLSSWLGTRRLLGGSKLAVTFPGLAGIGAAAGIPFTVSLLIASLAFTGARLDEAKLGVLAAAVLSSLLAAVLFRLVRLLPKTMRARQLSRTAEQIVDLADDVDPAYDHIRGDDDGRVTLVEYANFQCQYCGRAEPMVRDLIAEWDDDLRYVFRHLPLADVHPNAQLAAEATEAAHAQGRFWEMHDLLFAHQDTLDPPSLRRWAGELGLDLERFDDDLRRRRHAPRVNADISSADASGVSGTPSFFINGRRHHGPYDEETLSRAVRVARARTLAAELEAARAG
ncbi:MAG TPA: Na+/H+ antiporter NhaA [Solirubrobacteraceae bacterium]|jgi:Na+/H+ antiporter NhaA|nr:Na+/H+ antiporter NhaA [Solirubrobacteraceae bacterium]